MGSTKPLQGEMRMKEESVLYFTEKEEEITKLLINIGTKKNVARILVFLANTLEATTRGIERGTDLRQPEVSVAMKYLVDEGWIKSRDTASPNKGRPMKLYKLVKPISKIMSQIEKQKKIEAKNQLELIKKLRISFQ